MDDIEAGDLVMIVRWPHEHVRTCGAPGVVSEVVQLQAKTACPTCGHVWREPAACLALGSAVPLTWLRKVPRTKRQDRPVSAARGVPETVEFTWRGS